MSPAAYDERLSAASHELHSLAQNLHVMQEEMNGIIEKLDFLTDIYNLVMTRPCPVRDSLQHLRSRTREWHRWLHNFRERTNIRIQLGFHLATQKDNRTNREIAELTGEIAKQTQRDSSAMIT
jgi:hypothetical protein